MKKIGNYKVSHNTVNVKIEELPQNVQHIIKSSEAYNKKSINVFHYYYDNLHEYGLDFVDINSENIDDIGDIEGFLLHLGQVSLNKGCDIFVYENKIIQVISHSSDDFLNDDCYDIKILGDLK